MVAVDWIPHDEYERGDYAHVSRAERVACHLSGHSKPLAPGRYIIANGSTTVVWHCTRCGMTRANAIPQRYLPVSSFPLARVATSTRPCEHCGRVDGVEVHHWAPRSLFADADHWPVGRLCPGCHHEWHAVIDQGRNATMPAADMLCRCSCHDGEPDDELDALVETFTGDLWCETCWHDPRFPAVVERVNGTRPRPDQPESLAVIDEWARARVAAMPRCRVCDQPLTAGQDGVHFSCRSQQQGARP